MEKAREKLVTKETTSNLFLSTIIAFPFQKKKTKTSASTLFDSCAKNTTDLHLAKPYSFPKWLV